MYPEEEDEKRFCRTIRYSLKIKKLEERNERYEKKPIGEKNVGVEYPKRII